MVLVKRNWVMIPQQAFSNGCMIDVDTVTSGPLYSDQVLIDIVVQHLLLAIDHDCIAVGLSFESPSRCTMST